MGVQQAKCLWMYCTYIRWRNGSGQTSGVGTFVGVQKVEERLWAYNRRRNVCGRTKEVMFVGVEQEEDGFR